MTSDSESILSVYAQEVYPKTDKKDGDMNIVLSGKTSFVAKKGVFDVDNMFLTSTPNKTYSIYFETNGINLAKPHAKEYLRTQ